MNAFENANVASGAAKWAAVALLGACAGAGLVYSLLGPAGAPATAPAPTPAQPTAPVIVQIMPPASPAPTIVREVQSPAGATVPAAPAATSEAPAAKPGVDQPAQAKPAAPDPQDKPRTPAAKPGVTIGRRININTAGQSELELLPSVGPALAKRIIEYREKNGPFKAPADLDAVKGIGAKTLEKLLPLITVEAEQQQPR